MKQTLTILLACCISATGHAQNKLEKISLIDNKVEILAPAGFTKMTQEMIEKKYPKSNTKPSVILTDENAEINLVVYYTPQHTTEAQIGAFRDFQLDALKKAHAELKVTETGIKNVNGKKVSYFKCLTQAIDQKVFNYFFFIDMDGRVLMFTFNCIEKLQPKWEKTADEIVASIKLK